MAEVAKWYVVHTYSGYENTVKATIERTVESRGLQEQIHAVSIPLETVTEVTESGATKTYDRKVFPGYVLVKMIMSDDAWYVIKNVRGVTGFVGSGTKPNPSWVWRSGKSWSITPWATRCALPMAPLPPSQAWWRLWTRRRTRSAWPYRCSAAKPRWSWSSTR